MTTKLKQNALRNKTDMDMDMDVDADVEMDMDMGMDMGRIWKAVSGGLAQGRGL